MPHSIRVLSCSLSGTSARGGAADTNSSSRPPHHSTCSRSSRTPITTVARGGGNLFGPGGGGGEGRLIMPGQQGGGGGRGGGGASGGRLIIPGQGSRPGRGGGPGGGPGGGTAPGRGGGPADSPSVFGAPPPPPPGASPIGVMLDAPSAANFRPPPGFMEEGAEASWILGADGGLGSSPGAEPFDVETALSMVRARARPWHQLAGLLRSLQAAGLDAMAVEVETGLERATQALWQTAAQVYASLKSDAVFPSEAMPAFDSPPGAPALHELRNLPADARRGAAEYLATGGEMLACGNGILEQVDADLASTLARAYREYERRPREREGFSDAPGDVLAYKHWRDAAECRREEDKEKALRKGLAVAVSAAAKERFESLSTEAIARVVPAAEAAAAAAAAGLLKMSAGGGGKLLPITISRLQPSETLFVPVPLLSLSLGAATREALAALPTARPSGPFGAFGGPSPSAAAAASPPQFVVLPSWTTVQGLSGLAAIPIDDLSAVPEVLAAAVVAGGAVGAKKLEEERERLAGPGLLVVDRDGGAKARARSAAGGGGGPSGVGAAVLAGGGEGGGALSIRDVEGVAAGGGLDSAATVLFVVRPPRVSVITESDSGGGAPFEM